MNVLHNSDFSACNPGCDLKVYTIEASDNIHYKYQELSDFLFEKDNYKFFDLEEFTPHDIIQKYNYIKNLQLNVPVTIYQYHQGNYLGTINYIWKIPLRNNHRSETENAHIIARINEELPKYYTRQMHKNALKRIILEIDKSLNISETTANILSKKKDLQEFLKTHSFLNLTRATNITLIFMPKHRSIAVSLVDLGSIIEEFHYGPYSRFWWKMSTDKENVTFFPLRIGQKTKTCLNSHDFFVTIVVESDPSNAISSVYLQIFENGTRFSGPLVLGWQDEDIIHKLLGDVLFVPISIIIESLKIFIYGIGISSQVDWLNAGSGYKSSLIYKFNGNKQAIYVSKIEEDKCILEIYQDNQMKKKFEGETPIAVWKKSELMKKYNGNLLFGLENSFVQTLIHQHKYVIDPGIRKELVNESQSLRRYLRKDFDKKLQIDDMGNAIHVSCITHAIKRYVKLGYDITSGENIEDAIKDLAGTHVAHIQPNRSQDRKSTLGTIQGITNWAEWVWPNDTDEAGYIYGRALPGFGLWNKFSPNDTEIVENDESSAETIDPTDPPSDTISKSHESFYKGWALKENQKIRTPVKRMVPEVKELLECMFHTGTANPRQKMSAQEMRNELLRRGYEGEISLDDIPKESTIANWITTFSRKWKQSMALRNMEEAENT
uniref:Uncharacterized protein n=1 Tax=Rhizophagus irregularis (strain DAOM 181602 / DAOM 197198 / MUCL 43194) TaxID=747089 RepID=U9TB68_RHIID